MKTLFIESHADPDASVRATAVVVPQDLFGPEKVEALWTEALADPDHAVRAAAVDHTGRLAQPREKIIAKLLERFAVETDTRVCRRIWRELDCGYAPATKALRKYFLDRLPVADAQEVRQIKFSEAIQGDIQVLKAVADRESALDSQSANDAASVSGASATPKEKPPADQGDDF